MQNFVLQTPSLQHVAGVKIVAQLWNQRDIFSQIETSFNNLPVSKLSKCEQKWKEIEEKVRSKVWALPLPETCKKELLNFIRPIGMEIITWCRYHNLNGFAFQFSNTLLPKQFFWSMHGTVEYTKTAESLVKDETVDVERRFEFACLNCLEDEARQLIGSIPDHGIHQFITEAEDLCIMEHHILIAYFACTLSGDQDRLDKFFQVRIYCRGWSVKQHLFKVVLNNGTRATCEYFFHRVSQAEKEQVYFQLPFCPTRSPTCGSMYYLSLMNEERRVRDILQESMDFLLTQLLRWPMQPLFVETAKRAWQWMESEECAEVLSEVIDKVKDGFGDYDYAQWFRVLWRLTCSEHKHNFLDDIGQLTDLISTKRKEYIQLVLNEAPADLLKELVEEKYTYDRISAVLMDERVIGDAALMECKQTAALNSSKDRNNVEKRLRSQHLSLLVTLVMEGRIKSREKKLDCQPRD